MNIYFIIGLKMICFLMFWILEYRDLLTNYILRYHFFLITTISFHYVMGDFERNLVSLSVKRIYPLVFLRSVSTSRKVTLLSTEQAPFMPNHRTQETALRTYVEPVSHSRAV